MKIIAPNKQYTGTSASVAFANGVGYTDNPHLIRWFRERGYTVEDTQGDEVKGKNTKPKGGSKSTGSKPKGGSKPTGSSKADAKDDKPEDGQPKDANEDGKLPTVDGSQEKEGEQ